MIYEGDFLRIVNKVYTWDEWCDSSQPKLEKTCGYNVGAVTWLEKEHLYTLKMPFVNQPFRCDLGLVAKYSWDCYTDSAGYHEVIGFIEVFGHITDSDAKEKFAYELDLSKQINDEARQIRKLLDPPPPTVDNRGFWSKLWEKLS